MTTTMKNTTMSKWTLQNNSNSDNQSNLIYHYVSNLGNTLKFQSHPTKSFCYDIIEATIPMKQVNKIINCFIMQGIAQHDYPGGFSEAIKTLTVK
jgi:hypothetical protein